MFCYCALEQSAALWASTYLSDIRGCDLATAAAWPGFFWSGITFGRLAAGFVANKIGDKMLIRAGAIVIVLGGVLIALPTGTTTFALAGMLIAGVGCAPIYPSIMHILPTEFGEEQCQSILPMCWVCANAGSIVVPMLLGIVASATGIGIFPYALLTFSVLVILLSESMHRSIAKAKAAN